MPAGASDDTRQWSIDLRNTLADCRCDLSQNPEKPFFREGEAPAEPRVLLVRTARQEPRPPAESRVLLVRTARQEPRPPAESITCHLAKQLSIFKSVRTLL